MSEFYLPSASFDPSAVRDFGDFDNPYVDDWASGQFQDAFIAENVKFEFPGVNRVDEVSGVERVLNAMQSIDAGRDSVTESMNKTVDEYSEANQVLKTDDSLNPEMASLLRSQQEANMHFFKVQESLQMARNEFGILTEQAAWTREIAKKGVDSVNRVISNQ